MSNDSQSRRNTRLVLASALSVAAAVSLADFVFSTGSRQAEPVLQAPRIVELVIGLLATFAATTLFALPYSSSGPAFPLMHVRRADPDRTPELPRNTPWGQARDTFTLLFQRNYGPFFLATFFVLLACGSLIALTFTGSNESAKAAASLSKLLNRRVVPPRNDDPVAVTVAALELLQQMIDAEDKTLMAGQRFEFARLVEHDVREAMQEVEQEALATKNWIETALELKHCRGGRLARTTNTERTFVPEQLNSLLKDNAGTIVQEVKRADAWVGRLKTISERLNKMRSSTNYAIVQAYYESAHGVTANWSESLTPSCDIYANDDGYSLAERPYMIKLRDSLRDKKNSPIVTLDPYVDAGGRGIVGTTCVADVDEDGDVDKRQLRGAICADYRPLPKTALSLDKTLQSGLMEGTIKAQPSAATSLSDRTNVYCQEKQVHGDDTWAPHHQQSLSNEVMANPICWVPLATDNGLWLNMTYHTPSQVPLYCLCVAALLAAVSLAYAVRITASWRDIEARLGLLRDLPAAIVQVANGRDAEILEPARISQRLRKLRRWSHGTTREVFG